jgi:periplasmic copper chaperone A
LKTKTFLVAAAAALMLPAAAFAHAKVSPPVALKGQSQVYTLAVPTEKDDLTTTEVEMTPPQGFSIDSFVPTPGWKRTVQQTGSGEDAVITKVTWTGGKVPTGEDAAFSFLGQPADAKTYTFGVRQTYSDGSVVDWNGPESSDTPSPTLEAKSSFGGGSSSTLAIVALVVGAVGALLGGLALVSGGRRALA